MHPTMWITASGRVVLPQPLLWDFTTSSFSNLAVGVVMPTNFILSQITSVSFPSQCVFIGPFPMLSLPSLRLFTSLLSWLELSPVPGHAESAGIAIHLLARPASRLSKYRWIGQSSPLSRVYDTSHVTPLTHTIHT